MSAKQRRLELAVRRAKEDAGLNRDDKYEPRLFIDCLDEAWHPLFWDRQLRIVLEQIRTSRDYRA